MTTAKFLKIFNRCSDLLNLFFKSFVSVKAYRCRFLPEILTIRKMDAAVDTYKKQSGTMDCLVKNYLLILTLSLSLMCFAGCDNDSVGYVSGRVILATNDSPAGLYVTFMNGKTGVAATSVVDADGNYSLKYKGNKAVPIGKFDISVRAHEAEMSDEEYAKYIGLPLREKEKIRKQRLSVGNLVPKKYHDLKTSGLNYEVTDGSQTHDIDVSK